MLYCQGLLNARLRTLLLTVAFCLAVAATLFFADRAGHTARHARWQEEAIQPWMSIPFIAHTRHMSEAPLFEAIHVEPNPRDRRPLRDIARAEHVPVGELIRSLGKAIASDTASPAPTGKSRP